MLKRCKAVNYTANYTASRQLPEEKTSKDRDFKSGDFMRRLTNILLMKSETESEDGMVAKSTRDREYVQHRSRLARSLNRSQDVNSTVSRQLPEKKTPEDHVFKSGNLMSNLTIISLLKSGTGSKNGMVANSTGEREFAEYQKRSQKKTSKDQGFNPDNIPKALLNNFLQTVESLVSKYPQRRKLQKSRLSNLITYQRHCSITFSRL